VACFFHCSKWFPFWVGVGRWVLTTRGRAGGGRRLEGVSSKGARGHEEVVIKRDLRVSSRAVAQRRAEARRKLARENTFEVRIKHVRPLRADRIDVRDTIELANLGDLFNGKYLVDGVTYEASSRGFETTYDLYRK
jgi:hypothetical protein